MDPGGNVVINVPGTYSDETTAFSSDPALKQEIQEAYPGEEIINVENWAGPGSNSPEARTRGADLLEEIIDNHDFKPDEKLIINTHSHGGNVVKEYTQREDARNIDDVNNLGVPVRPDYTYKDGSVGKIRSFSSDADGVQRRGGNDGGGKWGSAWGYAKWPSSKRYDPQADENHLNSGIDTGHRRVPRMPSGHSGAGSVYSAPYWRQHVRPNIEKDREEKQSCTRTDKWSGC